MDKIKLILIVTYSLVSLPFYAAIRDKSFVLVIDPGHGGKDPGAVGAISKEKNINLAVATLVGEYIAKEHPDVRIIYTRQSDVFIELNQRAEIANKAKADLFISIHSNASKNKAPFGAETYTLGLAKTEENLEVAKRENAAILLEENYEQKYEGFDPNTSESYIIFEFMQNKFLEQSVAFASKIQTEFDATQRYDRGVRQAGFLVLRATGMPSVLVELGFISNRTEEKYLNSKSGQQQLAQSICSAFKQYKKDYDRKSGVTLPPAAIDEARNRKKTPSGTTTKSVTTYKVQILAAHKRLPKNSHQLKGYQTDFYIEKGLYKYTCGESSNWNEIHKKQKSLAKDFKGAFVVTFKNGVKVPQ